MVNVRPFEKLDDIKGIAIEEDIDDNQDDVRELYSFQESFFTLHRSMIEELEKMKRELAKPLQNIFLNYAKRNMDLTRTYGPPLSS